MLSEEVKRYRELSGDTNPHTPISRIGGYLDGYEKALDTLDKIRAEIEGQVLESLSDGGDDWFAAEKVNECLEIIDKYMAESEVEDEDCD